MALIIQNRYVLQETIGKGTFAVVYKCVDMQSNQTYAAKVFDKQKMLKRDTMKLDKEAYICRKLNHPNIVRLYEVISLKKIHILLFEMVTGGELFDELVTREGSYTEALAAKCMFQLLDTLKYCHKMGVVHRDLKPENILLESKQNNIIKLADFGLAVEVVEDEVKWFGFAGTPNYMAPEVIEMKPYGKPVDCWASGVIMYILLCGYMPFYHRESRKLEMLIKAGDYDLNGGTWSTVTPEGKDLIQKLLCVVPSQRLTAAAALRHPWFVKIKTTRSPFLHRAETFDALKHFNARRKLKAAIHTTVFISKVQGLLTAKKQENKDKPSDRTSQTSSSTRSNNTDGSANNKERRESSRK